MDRSVLGDGVKPKTLAQEAPLSSKARCVQASREGFVRGRKSRRCSSRLPSSKRSVSILQLWCSLNVCMSNIDLHRANLGATEGNMAKKAKKARKAKKSAKKKKK